MSQIDLSTSVLGQGISLPVILAPAGFQAMVHADAEVASARAAAAQKTIFTCNTISTRSLEEVAAATSAPKWYQLYMPPDRGAADELISRVETAGYSTLCLTVDAAASGKRERDLRNRFAIPLRPTPGTILEVLRHPSWAIDFALGGSGRKAALIPTSIDETGKVRPATVRPINLDDLDWLRDRWRGHLVVKGVLRGDDSVKAFDHGADGVVVSNHGGRQLDSAIPTITALREIAEIASGKGELFVDGGFRRGTDVVKALALGARAVLIGRPYVYGLAVGGQAGVEKVIDVLRHELETALALLGCKSAGEVGVDHLADAAPGL